MMGVGQVVLLESEVKIDGDEGDRWTAWDGIF